MADYYNYAPYAVAREPPMPQLPLPRLPTAVKRVRVPNRRLVRFEPSENAPALTCCQQFKATCTCSKENMYKLIPWVASLCGLGLIIVGITFYVFHIVEFFTGLDRYYNNYRNNGLRPLWEFIYFMVTVSLICEALVVFLTALLCLMLYSAIFNCQKVTRLPATTQTFLKATAILFMGMVVCYLQTVVSLYRFSTLLKINRWVNFVHCG